MANIVNVTVDDTTQTVNVTISDGVLTVSGGGTFIDNFLVLKGSGNVAGTIEVGDKVRIELKQNTFSKGHDPKWSKDFYEVEEIDGSKYYLEGLDRPYLRAELLLFRDVSKNPLPALLEDTLEGRLKEQAKLPKLPADVIQKEESISKRKGKRKIKKPKKLDL